jgi:hypothetical protein
LQQDNFHAAQAKMMNIVRAELMERLLNIAGEDAALKKNQFLTKVQHYFVEHQSSHFFERYGNVDEFKDTQELLKNMQKELLKDWQQLIQGSEQEISLSEQERMEQKLETILKQAIVPGVCADQQKTRANSLANEVEVQQEKQVQVEVELLTLKEMQQELYDPSHSPEPYQKWHVYGSGQAANKAKLQFKSLTEICQTTKTSDSPQFSPEIVASKNFYKTYQGQDKYLSMFLKPVHALLFRENQGKLECVLLTQEECDELYPSINSRNDSTCWLTSTQHTLLAGNPPEYIRDDKTYQSIIEQVRFFNGEFELLLHKDAPFSWLELDTQQKLAFYSQHLYPVHETLAADVNTLNKLLSTSRAGCIFMAKKPWLDYRNYNWSERYPDCDEEDIHQFNCLAQAFHEVTTEWDTLLNTQELATKHDISLAAMAYLNQYLEQLAALKNVLVLLQTQSALAKKQESPFALSSALPDELLKKLTSLCPELTFILKDNKTDRAEHQFLSILMKTIPMCVHQTELLTALSFNPHINETELTTLLNTATQNKTILYGLLTNSSPLISAKHLAEFTKAQFKHDEQTLSALAKNPHLSNEHYMTVFAKAKTYNIDAKIGSILLTHSDLNDSDLKKIIDRIDLNKEEIILILERPNSIEDAPLIQLLKDRLSANQILHTFLLEEIKKRSKDFILSKEIAVSYDPIFIEQSLKSPDAKKYSYIEAAQHPLSNHSLLISIAEKIEWKEIVSALLNRKDLNTPSPEVDSILNNLLKHRDLSPEHLNLIIMNANQGSILKSILIEHAQHLDAESLQRITNKKMLKDDGLQIIVKNPKTNHETLAQIATQATHQETIHAVLRSLLIKNTPKEHEKIYTAIANNQATPKEILLHLAKISESETGIAAILKQRNNDEEINSAVMNNQYTGFDSLLLIAQRTQNRSSVLAMLDQLDKGQQDKEPILKALVNNEQVKETTLLYRISSRSSSGDVLKALLKEKIDYLDEHILTHILVKATLNEDHLLLIANHPKANSDVLALVALKSQNTATLEAILQRNTGNDSDKVYQALAKNKNSSKSVLIDLAKKAYTDETVAYLLSREDMEHENALVLAALAKNAHVLKPQSINTMISLTNQNDILSTILENKKSQLKAEALRTAIMKDWINEENLGHLANHPETDQDTLTKVTQKAQGAESIYQILCKIVAKRNLSEECLSLIANHPQSHADTLAIIAAKTRNSTTIETVLNHQSSLDNGNIYRSILDNPSSPDYLLIETVNRTRSKDTFAALIQHQNVRRDHLILECFIKNTYLTNPDLIDVIANKVPSNSELNHLLLKHKRIHLNAATLFQLDTTIGILANDTNKALDRSPIGIYRALLEELIVVNRRLTVKTNPDAPNYNKNFSAVKKENEVLYDALNKLGHEFFANPTLEAYIKFKNCSHQAIKAAKVEFMKDRRDPIVRILLNVLNQIIGFFPWLFATIFPGTAANNRQEAVKNRFFTPKKPALAQHLDDLEKKLEEQESSMKQLIIKPNQ